MAQDMFFIDGVGYCHRNNLLRDMIAAIYNVAKVNPSFTTNEVFAALGEKSTAIRKGTANSKLIAVALRKAQVRGICYPATNPAKSEDVLSHARPKARWFSKIAAPQYTG